MGVIGITTTIKGSWEKIYGADGKCWMLVVPHGDLVANTPYKVIAGRYGPTTAALADDATTFYLGVPSAAVDSSEVDNCWVQIGGAIAALVTPSLGVTAGDSLTIDTGAIADGGAAASGLAQEFAVCTATSSASTTQAAYLMPERITATT